MLGTVLGKYWPSVVFVRTSLRSVRTATTSGQYSPVRPSCSVSKRLIFYFNYYKRITTFPNMIKITDYTREMKLFHKIAIGFSFPNNLHICVWAVKNFNFKFRTFPKKYLKEIIHIGSVEISKSLCFPLWILTLLIVKK